MIIIGTSGSGKTTFGNNLSKLLKIPCTDLDNLYWLPNWQKREENDFFNHFKEKLNSEHWIFCGNYTQYLQRIWCQADTIIWLDLPLMTCLWRALKRSIYRIIKLETCCNGNYETVDRLCGKDSILLWIWNSYSRRKKDYEEAFSCASDQNFVRLCNDQQIKAFVDSIKRATLYCDPLSPHYPDNP